MDEERILQEIRALESKYKIRIRSRGCGCCSNGEALVIHGDEGFTYLFRTRDDEVSLKREEE